ncbi:hypothetical protein ACH4E7_43950 [Kitasatospora sp. NPDC018058]|uniref:hypothetical protein n=1 Tax=Kitasatospora sp. NPDC018058 TaxID=3364025 RepID=UPI0037C02F30
MLVLAWRLAWRADRRALVGVVCAEVGRAAFAAVALVATNRVLAELLAGGSATRSLHRALVPLLVAGAATGAASWLSSASTWAAAVLEPQVERITTRRCCGTPTRSSSPPWRTRSSRGPWRVRGSERTRSGA